MFSVDVFLAKHAFAPKNGPVPNWVRRFRGALAISLLGLAIAAPAAAVEEVTLRRDGKEFEVAGRVLVDVPSGLLLLQARDGVLWQILPSERVRRTNDTTAFKPFTRDEMSKRVLAQLPKGFDVHPTKHYLIFYDTSLAYAQWCGTLFERLYGVFTNYWTRKDKGLELTEPEFPLVAVVFADKASYLKFSRPDLGDAGESIIGYFALFSNRMTMYDLTGVEAQDRGRSRGKTTAQINEILAQPEAQRGVSTIVHEATHQISFNCGLQTRLSDCPHWFSEGIAEFFEAPDIRNPKGWSGVGVVNRPRLEQFRKYMAFRPSNSLETLIRDDKRFTDSQQALDAYAEAWALTDFLIRKHSKDYTGYMSMLSKKKPLLSDTPDERIDEFRRAFGELKTLDAEFLRYMRPR